MSVNHPQKLVELYRAFYRAPLYKMSKYGPSARKAVQPVYDSFDIICRCDRTLRDTETLTQVIAGENFKLMSRIRGSSDTLGWWVISDREKEQEAILEFSKYLVEEVFYKAFGGDVGRFAGRQRGYLENACEFLYRIAQDEEKKLKANA
ncbi:MAG: type I-D CRISPR-associated protein Cas10d/Csc3 [Nostoc sp. NMS7]|uniref:type I-D CRISPR-associated protein Cas10d/Csc3 n=1 Tax=Nostoc sp. NMS7 TaxID=2815391 RepID=UPI0025D702DC|nr:type I-D CRISPR-associated protein Cas10d/Csc3 [Nostoc sp. NMS7]MBN3948425.1 type I-D CRISPR-associated protein Cas10d/Csc3 [Nostoc sp. NMS7]